MRGAAAGGSRREGGTGPTLPRAGSTEKEGWGRRGGAPKRLPPTRPPFPGVLSLRAGRSAGRGRRAAAAPSGPRRPGPPRGGGRGGSV